MSTPSFPTVSIPKPSCSGSKQPNREDRRSVFTFYSSARPRGLVETHLIYNSPPPSSDTIKTLYSDREQWEELKMTRVLLQIP